MPRGKPQIEVTFDIDANGILQVTALDRNCGKSNKITGSQGKRGLGPEDLERMMREAEGGGGERTMEGGGGGREEGGGRPRERGAGEEGGGGEEGVGQGVSVPPPPWIEVSNPREGGKRDEDGESCDKGGSRERREEGERYEDEEGGSVKEWREEREEDPKEAQDREREWEEGWILDREEDRRKEEERALEEARKKTRTESKEEDIQGKTEGWQGGRRESQGAGKEDGKVRQEGGRMERGEGERVEGGEGGEREDYTVIPRKLDENCRRLDAEGCLRPTVIGPAEIWTKKAQASLLSPPRGRLPYPSFSCSSPFPPRLSPFSFLPSPFSFLFLLLLPFYL
jgi:hypothetical protein